jgi:hypothetical protein
MPEADLGNSLCPEFTVGDDAFLVAKEACRIDTDIARPVPKQIDRETIPSELETRLPHPDMSDNTQTDLTSAASIWSWLPVALFVEADTYAPIFALEVTIFEPAHDNIPAQHRCRIGASSAHLVTLWADSGTEGTNRST